MVSISKNASKGGIEISFPYKPTFEVLNWLKSKGFAWGKFNKVWWIKFNEQKWIDAHEYFGVTLPTTVSNNPEPPIVAPIESQPVKEPVITEIPKGIEKDILFLLGLQRDKEQKKPNEWDINLFKSSFFNKIKALHKKGKYAEVNAILGYFGKLNREMNISPVFTSKHGINKLLSKSVQVITQSVIEPAKWMKNQYIPKATSEKIIKEETGLDILGKDSKSNGAQITALYHDVEESEGFFTFSDELIFVGKKLDKTKPFFAAYFGDISGNTYERAIVGQVLSDVLEELKNWDQQEAMMNTYNPMNGLKQSFVIYPFANQYEEQTLIDAVSNETPSGKSKINELLSLSKRDLEDKTTEELDNLISQLEQGATDLISVGGETEKLVKLRQLIGVIVDLRSRDNVEYNRVVGNQFEPSGRAVNPGLNRPEFMTNYPDFPLLKGREIQLSMPNGEKRNAIFAIVELENIIASHNEENFHSEPLYPKNASGNNINDRNYKDDLSAQKAVMDYARELEPERLITTSRTPSGTPIITKDGFVVSGNNRTMSLKLAAKQYPENYKEYTKYLLEEMEAYGFSRSNRDSKGEEIISDFTALNSFEHPVLVRIDLDFPEYTTQELAKYNKDTKKSERPIDKAIKLSNILRDNSRCADIIASIVGEYDTFTEFYANIAGQKQLSKTLVECNLLTEQELPAYYSETTFTESGKEFLESLLAALILDREALLATEQPGIKATRQKLLTALPVLMKNASLPEGSLKQKINDAVILQYSMKGSTFPDFIRQRTMFGTTYDRKAVYINRLIDSGKIKFKQAIEGYNNAILQNQGASLFGEKPSVDEIFNHWIVGGISETDKNLIESSDVVAKEETFGTFAGQVPAESMEKAWKNNTPIREVFEAAGKEYPKPEPKFKAGDIVRYKQGDINIEHWYGIIKEVRDLGKEYVYRIDGYALNESGSVMFDSEKTNEKYEPQLSLLSTISLYEGLKNDYELHKVFIDETDGFKIYSINGEVVRKSHIEFTMGGHGYVYDYVPKNEIWIDENLNDKPDDRYATIKHELFEVKKMRDQGLSYEDAHELANVMEKEVRNSDSELSVSEIENTILTFDQIGELLYKREITKVAEAINQKKEAIETIGSYTEEIKEGRSSKFYPTDWKLAGKKFDGKGFSIIVDKSAYLGGEEDNEAEGDHRYIYHKFSLSLKFEYTMTNEVQGISEEYSSLEDFARKHAGQRIGIQVGSGTRTNPKASIDFITEEIIHMVNHNFFDWDFYYNYIEEGDKAEYKHSFNKYREELLSDFPKFYSTYIKKQVDPYGGFLIEENMPKDVEYLFFQTHKGDISDSIKKSYYTYREEYAGEKLDWLFTKEQTPSQKEYKYRMTQRPFGTGTYPTQGLIRFEKVGSNPDDQPFGTIVMDHKLAITEWSKWDLLPITEINEMPTIYHDKDGNYSLINVDWFGNHHGANIQLYEKSKGEKVEGFSMSVKDIFKNTESGYWIPGKVETETVLQPPAPPKKYAKLKRFYNGMKEGTFVEVTGRPNMFVSDILFEDGKKERVDNGLIEFVKELPKGLPIQTEVKESNGFVLLENGVIKFDSKEAAEKVLSRASVLKIGYSVSFIGREYTKVQLGETMPDGWYGSKPRDGQGNKLPFRPLLGKTVFNYVPDLFVPDTKKPDTKDDIAEVRLQKLMLLRKFISVGQHKALSNLMNGEEGAAGWEIVDTLGGILQTMPQTYQTQKTDSDDKKVYLHYFHGGSDWYIVEKDKNIVQNQAFGYAILNGDTINAEWGYISIVELILNGVELDFYFTPVKFGELVSKWDEREENRETEKSRKSYGYDFMFEPVNTEGAGLITELQRENIPILKSDLDANVMKFWHRNNQYTVFDNSGEFKVDNDSLGKNIATIYFTEDNELKSVAKLAYEIKKVINQEYDNLQKPKPSKPEVKDIFPDVEKMPIDPVHKDEIKDEGYGTGNQFTQNGEISLNISDYTPYTLNRAIEKLLDEHPDNEFFSDKHDFIRGYSGYGGLDEEVVKAGAQIDRGSLYEFYTPENIIEKMWGLAYKHGYNEGSICEPSSGIGEFFNRKFVKSHIPKVAYETNKYSARICQILYPEVVVYNHYFEQAFIRNNYTVRGKVSPVHELVIGNPPYGAVGGKYMGMGEGTYSFAKNYIDYFIFRGLDLLKKDGLLIFIVGAEVAAGGKLWLDQGDSKCKQLIAEKGKLIDAYRLPEGIFGRTNVVSDIVVFRKK